MRFFFLLMTLLAVARGAPARSTTDSYSNIQASTEDINENLIEYEQENRKPEEIEGLLPPMTDAEDYYHNLRESAYSMGKDTLTLKSDSKMEEPSSDEKQAFKEVTALIAKLLEEGQGTPSKDETRVNLNPTVFVSDAGVAVEMDGVNDKSGEVNFREHSTEKQIEITTEVPEDATDYPADEARSADEEDSSVLKFFTDIWHVVQSSVSYAGRLISELTTRDARPSTETEAPSTEKAVVPLLALEEPAFHHRLPSQEFEKGGRDIDSLLYGRGIA